MQDRRFDDFFLRDEQKPVDEDLPDELKKELEQQNPTCDIRTYRGGQVRPSSRACSPRRCY